MPPKSPSTWLPGPGSPGTDVTSNASMKSDQPFYIFEAAPPGLGASQQAAVFPTFPAPSSKFQTPLGALQDQGLAATTPKEWNVAVAPSRRAPSFAAGPLATSTLRTRQLWEGTITDVRSDGFIATLVDKTNPDNPDEQVLFPLGEVSEDDAAFIAPGSAFYWTIGSERTPAGQIKNVSMVQFRRLPTWTQNAIARAADRARLVSEFFATDKSGS